MQQFQQSEHCLLAHKLVQRSARYIKANSQIWWSYPVVKIQEHHVLKRDGRVNMPW